MEQFVPQPGRTEIKGCLRTLEKPQFNHEGRQTKIYHKPRNFPNALNDSLSDVESKRYVYLFYG